MTEKQATDLAWEVFMRLTHDLHNHDIEIIKEALMDAYNTGFENGFEEAKETQ